MASNHQSYWWGKKKKKTKQKKTQVITTNNNKTKINDNQTQHANKHTKMCDIQSLLAIQHQSLMERITDYHNQQ